MRCVLRLLLIAITALLLAACTITSDRPLTSEDEAAAPLPDAFTFFPYEQTADGYVPEDIAPMQFVRQGADYMGTDEPGSTQKLDVRFIRLNDTLFLLAAATADSPTVTYGFVRYDDGVLSVAMSPDASTAAAIAKQRRRMMPQDRLALNGLAVAKDGSAITVTTRAALDELGRLYGAGQLPMDAPAVGYISLDPGTPPPSRLVQSGPDWIEIP